MSQKRFDKVNILSIYRESHDKLTVQDQELISSSKSIFDSILEETDPGATDKEKKSTIAVLLSRIANLHLKQKENESESKRCELELPVRKYKSNCIISYFILM